MFVVLENIRSAYNVGNIIRTADALSWDVIISGYTPSPFKDEKVVKTSLGAEKSVNIQEFWNTKDCINFLKSQNYTIIAAEITDSSIDIIEFVKTNKPKLTENLAIIMGNEVDGVLKETLDYVNFVVHLPMKGKKESLNVGQAAAIFMWELGKAL